MLSLKLLLWLIVLFVSQERIVMDPIAYSEVRTRPSLEERLESIISGAALMADSSCTRDERRERIVAECNAVRQALQDLLSEYMSNVSVKSQDYFLSRWNHPKKVWSKTEFQSSKPNGILAIEESLWIYVSRVHDFPS